MHDVDYDLICDWWRARRLHPLPEEALPDCGLMLLDDDGEEILAIFLYFDATSSCCFASHCVTRPKLPVSETVAAMRELWPVLKERARGLGAHHLQIFAPRAFGRYLVKEGMTADRRLLMNLSIDLNPEEEKLCLGKS